MLDLLQISAYTQGGIKYKERGGTFLLRCWITIIHFPTQKISHTALSCFFEKPYTHRDERPLLNTHCPNFSQITAATLQTGYFSIDLDQFLLRAHVKERVPPLLKYPLARTVHTRRTFFVLNRCCKYSAYRCVPVSYRCGHSTCLSQSRGVSYVIESLMKITAKGLPTIHTSHFTLHTSLHSHSVAVTIDNTEQ
jgi:hypothetical protein